MRSRNKGSEISSFAAAIAVLIAFVIPLVDLAIIPVRYALAKNVIESFARKLGEAENASDAYSMLDDPQFDDSLLKLGGMGVKDKSLKMEAISEQADGKSHVADQPKSMPGDWLPSGSNCPCHYMLELSVQAEIYPLVTFKFGGKKIPGLNAPFLFSIDMSVPWENTTRDPMSGGYFLNE